MTVCEGAPTSPCLGGPRGPRATRGQRGPGSVALRRPGGPVPTLVPKARLPPPRPGSPLSCSMKHTLPLVLKASVSGVMHRVWKMAAWATLLMDRLHSRHTAHASCSLRPLSRSERMSARDTFSCQDRPRLRRVRGGRRPPRSFTFRQKWGCRQRLFEEKQQSQQVTSPLSPGCQRPQGLWQNDQHVTGNRCPSWAGTQFFLPEIPAAPQPPGGGPGPQAPTRGSVGTPRAFRVEADEPTCASAQCAGKPGTEQTRREPVT